jgi:hypothetical protein
MDDYTTKPTDEHIYSQMPHDEHMKGRPYASSSLPLGPVKKLHQRNLMPEALCPN